MTLKLDPTQRLNLHALMGAQRCNVDDLRAYWRLQDQIDLSEVEKKTINYRLVGEGDGPRQPTWDLNGAKAATFNFSDEDYARLKKVVKEWQPGFLTTADRRWLEPLLNQLDENEQEAGKKKSAAN